MGRASTSAERRRLGAALTLLLATFPGRAGAQESPPSAEREVEEQRLEGVRREIERLQSTLNEVQGQERTVLGELQRLDLELALHRRQLILILSELEKCRREIKETAETVDRLHSRLDRTSRTLSARLRALYLSGPPVLERVVLTAQRPQEVVEAYRAASLIARADSIRIEAFRADLFRLQEEMNLLQARRAELASLKNREVTRRRDLEAARSDRGRLLTGIHKEVEDRRQTLHEMAETEKDLHRLVEALSAGQTVPPEWRVGFVRFRGLLAWPVPGKVLVPFGVQKNTRFGTAVPHPGVDLAVEFGQPVRAVFDGRVAFSDWFKGYGNLVILEHGGGFMTIYAHASERLVSSGDRVRAGEAIARGGDTGSLEGPRLYFEIWRDGKPEDPLSWLARR